MNGFRLQFDPRRIARLADSYTYPNEPYIAEVLGPRVQKRRWFTLDDFLELGDWKTRGRSVPLMAENSAELVKEATRTALTAESEELRIGALRVLRGVDWPVASTMLHFGHRDRYPILDFRALEALGVRRGSIRVDFDFWWTYVVECRRLADRYKVSMRTLDKALWAWRPAL